MKTHTLIALSILLSPPAILHSEVQAAQRDAARAAIEAQSASFTASLAKGDATEAARNFTADARLLRDARGVPLKGRIDNIDVMRRGPGLGAAYGEERAGEWGFASYHSDGSMRVAFDKAVHCAACHRNAGADKDFVFRTRPWSPQ